MTGYRSVHISTGAGFSITIQGSDPIAVFEAALTVVKRLPEDMPGVKEVETTVNGWDNLTEKDLGYSLVTARLAQ